MADSIRFRSQSLVPALLLAFVSITSSSLSAFPQGAAPAPKRADFSGTWALNDSLSEDPVEKWMRGQDGEKKGAEMTEASGRGSRRGGGQSGGFTGDLTGIPPELLENNKSIVIVDRGTSIKFSRRPGEERSMSLDGEETELEFGAGPVNVKANRKGSSGERILVSMAWHNGRKVKETWELSSSPRRITVITEIPGRNSIVYRRVYDLAPERPPESATPVAKVALPVPAATAASASAPAVAVPAPGSPRPECSIKPGRGTPPEELAKLAKITVGQAAEKATTAVSPRRPNSVISSEVEVDAGCLVYTFLLRFDGQKGFQEVVVDAGDGKVLSSKFESP